ncbi:MAG: succinylglutamate desuccinylase/aspartoacylase family protein, partial [Halobacteria archaeon]|nr:succinylglutamate desuccinylase/aspartoacylase family protein [Halobacteria archaeon]
MNISDPEPEITVRGPGEASLAVVGSIHGDEPSGAEAIRRVLNEDLEYSEAVKFVVANPRALEAGERYVDVDMNRNFPGDSESDEVEERLAAK